jgi:hypothetical protein
LHRSVRTFEKIWVLTFLLLVKIRSRGEIVTNEGRLQIM